MSRLRVDTDHQPRPGFGPEPGSLRTVFGPQVIARVWTLAVIVCIAMGVLVFRLWFLQVLSSDEFQARADSNQQRVVPIEARRGLITDRHGQELVGNRASLAVGVYPAKLPKGKRGREIKATLRRVLGLRLGFIEDKINASATDRYGWVRLKSSVDKQTIFFLREQQLPGIEVRDEYERSYPEGTAGAQLMGRVGEITKEQLALPAYAGRDRYQAGDKIGQAGLEARYDDFVKGVNGASTASVDAIGRPVPGAPVQLTQAIPGDTLRTTLDAGLERAAQRSLERGIRDVASVSPQPLPADVGAVVALDPRTGAVLAMASSPSYDPANFDRNYNRILPKQARLGEPSFDPNFPTPARNYADEEVFQPGSTFKPFSAIAALQSGKLTPETAWPDQKIVDGRYCADPTNKATCRQNFENESSSAVPLVTAITQSVDTYFYEVGDKLFQKSGVGAIPRWAGVFGYGKPTGVDLGGEAAGAVDTAETWKDKQLAFIKRFDPQLLVPGNEQGLRDATDWFSGFSLQQAIGQTTVQVTVLQQAAAYAALANGGTLHKPYLADARLDASGRVVQDLRPPPADSVRLPVDRANLDAVREGLLGAAQTGTSAAVFGPTYPIQVAGKTGTAEIPRKVPGAAEPVNIENSWYCGYAPADNPQLTVCSFVRNGGEGAKTSAPVVKRVFDAYFGIVNGRRTARTAEVLGGPGAGTAGVLTP